MTDQPSSLSRRAEARAVAKAAGDAHRAPGGLFGPRRLRLFPPADRCRDEGQPRHGPARSRQGARRMAAPCARAPRLRAGRAPVEGALPCRLPPGPSRGSRRATSGALGPYLTIVAALDRLHGLDRRLPLPRAAQARNALTAPPPPLALTHAVEPALRRSRRKLHNLAPKTLKSLARLSTLHGRTRRAPRLVLAHAVEPALPPLPSKVAQTGA